MNAVVLDALIGKMDKALSGQLTKKHDAAVKLAISVAQLPEGSSIILQTEHHGLRTDILIREPLQVDYSILARVEGEEVVFTDNIADAPKGGDGQ